MYTPEKFQLCIDSISPSSNVLNLHYGGPEIPLPTRQCQGSEAVKEVIDFYGADFSPPDSLETQLTLLHTNLESPTDLFSVFSYLKSLSSAEKMFYTEVMKVVKLILIMPANNATSERSFSALHRLKTWLRTTTTQLGEAELV